VATVVVPLSVPSLTVRVPVPDPVVTTRVAVEEVRIVWLTLLAPVTPEILILGVFAPEFQAAQPEQVNKRLIFPE
jgi:hypothetical protein